MFQKQSSEDAAARPGHVNLYRGFVVLSTLVCWPITEAKASKYDWPPFMNWDCVGVRGILHWDQLFTQLEETLPHKQNVGYTRLPEHVQFAVETRGDDLARECPLGSIYLEAIYAFFLLEGMGTLEQLNAQGAVVASKTKPFPALILAGTRWRIYEAFFYFSSNNRHRFSKVASCENVTDSAGTNWGEFLNVSLRWASEQLLPLEPDDVYGPETSIIRQFSVDLFRDTHGKASVAQDACPFGYLFALSAQMLAAATSDTGLIEPWFRAVDQVLDDLQFYTIAATPWPTYQILAMMSASMLGRTLMGFQEDVNRWGGAHPVSKRFRSYGDLRLSANELAPFGTNPESYTFIDQLVQLDTGTWCLTIAEFTKTGQSSWASDSFKAALWAAYSAICSSYESLPVECGMSGTTTEQCRKNGCDWRPQTGENADSDLSPVCTRPRPARKLVAVTFVWGEAWAPIVPKFVGWASNLALPTVIVAMGAACKQACESAASTVGRGIYCWNPFDNDVSDPGRGSIVQRHALVHLVLHLGLDVLAFDFDTFWFSNPQRRLESIASEGAGADVLMSRHLDADCFNMGLLYIQASGATAKWYSKYLQWYHQHTYEREQRGINSLLGFTNQSVSFPPKDMPMLRVAALDELNEFATSRGGWFGNWSNWSKIRFFHWVNPVKTPATWSEVKRSDLGDLYDVVQDKAVIRALVGSGFSSLAQIIGDSAPAPALQKVRQNFELLRTETQPERQKCW